MDIVIERKVHWNRAAYQAVPASPVAVAVEAKRTARLTTPAAATVPHAVANFKRPLNEKEENIIKEEFLKLNGIFEPLKKDCSRIRALLADEITVFQVSGYVTKLHKLAVSGELELNDRRAYLANLKAHRKHWLTYQGEKYDEMRERVGGRKPQFAARPQPVYASVARHRMTR